MVEIKFVIPRLGRIVVNRPVGRTNYIFQRLRSIRGVDDEFIEFIDIPHIVFVMVVTKRLLGYLWLEGIISIRKLAGRETRSGSRVGSWHNKMD